MHRSTSLQNKSYKSIQHFCWKASKKTNFYFLDVIVHSMLCSRQIKQIQHWSNINDWCHISSLIAKCWRTEVKGLNYKFQKLALLENPLKTTGLLWRYSKKMKSHNFQWTAFRITSLESQIIIFNKFTSYFLDWRNSSCPSLNFRKVQNLRSNSKPRSSRSYSFSIIFKSVQFFFKIQF